MHIRTLHAARTYFRSSDRTTFTALAPSNRETAASSLRSTSTSGRSVVAARAYAVAASATLAARCRAVSTFVVAIGTPLPRPACRSAILRPARVAGKRLRRSWGSVCGPGQTGQEPASLAHPVGRRALSFRHNPHAGAERVTLKVEGMAIKTRQHTTPLDFCGISFTVMLRGTDSRARLSVRCGSD